MVGQGPADAVVAELIKLRTLPAVVLAAVGTVLAGGAVAVLLAASAAEYSADLSTVELALRAVPFVQVGIVLLGVLPAGHEYAGGQFRTSLVAVPGRWRFAAAKAVAAVSVLAVVAVVGVAASLGGATLGLRLAGGAPTGDGVAVWPLLGACAYLTLVGLLSHAVAVLVRHLVPALVAMLTVVLVVSPLLGTMTEQARWLPDRAGGLLMGGSDTALDAGSGTLVLLGWVAAVGGMAVVRATRTDA